MPIAPHKILALMNKRKLSHAAAARAADMAPPHWRRLLRGDRLNPSLATAEKIAGALRVGVEEILTTEGKDHGH